MATSSGRLEVCNMALGYVGTRTIGSPNERTPEAIQCGLFWDRARRSALRDYPYRFAQKRFQLAEVELPDLYGGEWKHAYGMPDQILKVVRVHNGRERGRKAPYSIERTDDGPVILCDIPQAQATCTVDVEDITQWDEAFVMVMARKLAALIAVPLLKHNSSKVQELVQLYQSSVPQSEGADGSEACDRKDSDSWLIARGRW